MGTDEVSFIAVGCGFRLKSVFLIDFRCKFSRNFGPQFMIKYSINKKIAMAFLDQKHLKIDAVKEKNVRVLTSNGVHVFGVRCLIQILCNRNPTSVIFVCIQYFPKRVGSGASGFEDRQHQQIGIWPPGVVEGDKSGGAPLVENQLGAEQEQQEQEEGEEGVGKEKGGGGSVD